MAQLVTFILFGGLGLMLLVVGGTQWLQQRRNLAHAERVDATITHSQVFTSASSNPHGELLRSDGSTTHRPDLRFSYTVAGRHCESDLLYPTRIVRSYASHDAAAQVLAPFPVGAKVRAHVDRAQPDKAFLIDEASQAPCVFIVLGLLLPPLAWFVGKVL
jgi:hypothetical protein